MLRLNMFDETYVDRHAETDDERRALRAVKRKIKVNQRGGDDGYHFRVVVNDRVLINGCTRSEAYGHANALIVEEMEKRGHKLSDKQGAY